MIVGGKDGYVGRDGKLPEGETARPEGFLPRAQLRRGSAACSAASDRDA